MAKIQKIEKVVHKFEYLTITIEGDNLHISMDYKQHFLAMEDDKFEDSRGYNQNMFDLFEDAHVDGYFHWWDGEHPSLGLTEAPYISTEQTYCDEHDMFLPAGDIYYFPYYTVESELEILKGGGTVTYVKLHEQ